MRARADGSFGASARISRSLSWTNFSHTSSGTAEEWLVLLESPPSPDPDLGSSDDLSATVPDAFLRVDFRAAERTSAPNPLGR
ncbi:hypothetical protein GCM10022232_78900 [Streptomyces plumbiresistens]|uniref:Uncharacterized protein n=1 Tax=Streptomyces plumbiresistens TaxID=511811 RepID=A0ABP7T7F9_9ACTN